MSGVGELPTLKFGHVSLRPFADEDVEAFSTIIREQSVSRWWGDDTDAELRAGLLGHFAIEIDGRFAGILEAHEESTPTYPSVALDIALSTEFQHEGHGPEALRLVIRHFIDLGHHRFTIDPNINKDAAIVAYKKVGFEPIGIARKQELQRDGTWEDSLLMDLLAEELVG